MDICRWKRAFEKFKPNVERNKFTDTCFLDKTIIGFLTEFLCILTMLSQVNFSSKLSVRINWAKLAISCVSVTDQVGVKPSTECWSLALLGRDN